MLTPARQLIWRLRWAQTSLAGLFHIQIKPALASQGQVNWQRRAGRWCWWPSLLTTTPTGRPPTTTTSTKDGPPSATCFIVTPLPGPSTAPASVRGSISDRCGRTSVAQAFEYGQRGRPSLHLRLCVAPSTTSGVDGAHDSPWKHLMGLHLAQMDGANNNDVDEHDDDDSYLFIEGSKNNGQ